MINPRDFLANSPTPSSEEIEEIGGSFSCPEQGCYKTASEGLFNPNTRVVTWVCPEGHTGKATI